MPNTPKAGAGSRLNANKRKFETPSISRLKLEPASSPPDFKLASRPAEQGGA